MSDDNLLTRREFTSEWVMAVLAGAMITITGCGGDDNDNPGTNPSGQSSGNEVATFSANHGHELTITAVEITAGQALVRMTTGSSATHTHTVSLTAAQVVSIGQQQQVTVVSSTDAGHNHNVTFN